LKVPVLDRNKKPLMPCSPKRARKLMERGEAKPYWSRGVFCIILQKEPSGRAKQKIVVGVDSGSKMEGYTVKSKKDTFLNIQSEAVTWVKRKVKTRREARRTRRTRNNPYRANKSNRACLRKNRIPPATKARWGLKLRVLNWLSKLYPISHVVVEDVKAVTKSGKRAWNKSFSPLQAGKAWFYQQIKNTKLKSKLKLKLVSGFYTSKLRTRYGLHKSKSKMDVNFNTHCVDSWVMADNCFKGRRVVDNSRVLFIQPLNFARRQLHKFNAKKGVRANYGGTRSLGLNRGALVKHVKHGLCLVGGTSKGKISLHAADTYERLYRNANTADCELRTNFRWAVQWA
jgi:hypothetical protein